MATLDASTVPVTVEESAGRTEVCVLLSPALAEGQSGTVQLVTSGQIGAQGA